MHIGGDGDEIRFCKWMSKTWRLHCLLLQASEDLLMQHYIDLKDRPFFPTLIKYMTSGPVVAMVSVPEPDGLKPHLWNL